MPADADWPLTRAEDDAGRDRRAGCLFLLTVLAVWVIVWGAVIVVTIVNR